MKYAYNGNLLEEERINVVVKEIVDKYDFISLEEAREIAMLEGRISKPVNVDMQFTRLYNILLVMQSDKQKINTIFIDLVQLIRDNKNTERYSLYFRIILELDKYFDGNRQFPYLSEFM